MTCALHAATVQGGEVHQGTRVGSKLSGRMRVYTHYEILGVPRVASREEIRSAFRRLVKKYHPDMTPGVEGSRFRQIMDAYKTLSNPRARKAYDRHLRKTEEEQRGSGYPLSARGIE